MGRPSYIALLFVVGLAGACSNASDHPPQAGAPSGIGAPASSGRPIESDSGTVVANDGGVAPCVGATQLGSLVAEVTVAGDAPPPLGGALQPGTYALIEMNEYGSRAAADGGPSSGGGGALTGKGGRGTLVLAGDTLQLTGARGPTSPALPPDDVEAFSFTAAGTSLQLTSRCPAAGTRRSLPYSAVGGGLAIFPDATHRELYAAP